MNRKLIVKVPPFLSKLYDIVSNEKYKDIITWNDLGDSFVINDLSKFCELILPLYFKHSNFASFVRQLNMYDFHKTKQKNGEPTFQHTNFVKDKPNQLAFIKRKNHNTNNEVMKKGVNFRKKKVDFETIKKDTIRVCNILEDLKRRVETLEGKHDYLEICHSELASRNHKIKYQLNSLIEKEKNLENLLMFALKSLAANFFIKNNDLKYIENNTLQEGENTIYTQLMDLSSYQKNDVLNKIFKEIKSLMNYYYILNNTESEYTSDPNAIKSKAKITDNIKLEEIENKPISKFIKRDNNFNNINMEASNELIYNNQIQDLQNYFNDDDQTTNRLKINSSNVKKIVPRKSSVQIIENNLDYNYNSDDTMKPSSGFFDIAPDLKNLKGFEHKSSLMNLKRRRSNSLKDYYDGRFHDSNYKLEKYEN